MKMIFYIVDMHPLKINAKVAFQKLQIQEFTDKIMI